MIVSPSQYASSSAYDLLRAAADGHIGLDRRFVRAIVERGPEALPDLLRFAGEDRSRDLVDLEEELIGFFRQLRSPDAVPYFIDLVRGQPEDIPDDVVQALAEIGGPAVEPLIALYDELDAEDTDIPFLLASMRVRHSRVLAILLDRLEFDMIDAAFCLELYGDEAARPALERALAALSDSDPDVRRAIEEALDRLGKPEQEPVLEPYDIWSAYPEEDTPHFDLLSEQEKIAFLGSGESEYRALAARSLSKTTLSGKSAGALRRTAESDPDPKVRAECWEALGPASQENPELRARLLALLTDTSVPLVERGGALVALSGDGDTPIHNHILEFYAEEGSRPKALEAMWRSLNPRYAIYFPKHLEDASLDMRREAVWGIGHLRIQSEAARLRKLFQDEDLRSDALFNYAVAWPGEISRNRARSLMRRIEEWAGGLSAIEAELVQTGIDERLVFEGLRPVFSVSESQQDDDLEEVAVAAKVGRNEACPCGSGKKYKKCCGQ